VKAYFPILLPWQSVLFSGTVRSTYGESYQDWQLPVLLRTKRQRAGKARTTKSPG
jgi:hypothetical protein